MSTAYRFAWTSCALAALLGVAWVAYMPGLLGGFLFDDFPNLAEIGATGPVDDWPTFWRYITSGTADPLGRPVALLSFLLDARDWPAEPAPFLRTNLLLHLLNGTLLFTLLRMLGRRVGDADNRADGAALLGAGIWLLHPLFVSTTLYIVQRHAMLPATFVLLGLIAYVHGRGRQAAAPGAAAAWMVAGIAGGTTLGMLCKANGVLLPLLALVLDATVLRACAPAKPPRGIRWLRWLLLGVPTLMVVGYLASFLLRLDAPMDRPWTIGERLLTEPRALLDYLRLLLVPQVLSSGLYNDDYPASSGLLQPLSTLPALIAVIGLVLLAVTQRRRAPALAAALLFFFAGHLLESTVVPLELYFEHRNYLPAMLLFWPLARAVANWRGRLAPRVAVAAALLAVCATTTWQRATLWGQPERMAQLWVLQNPDSARARVTAATHDLRGQRPDLALARLIALWRHQPYDLQLALNYANAACMRGGLEPADVAAIGKALRHADKGDQLVHRWLARAVDAAGQRQCPGLDLPVVEQWVGAAWDNPMLSALPGRRQDLHSLQGRMALLRGEPDHALIEFDRALAAWVTPGAAARQVALLAEAGLYEQAVAHLDTYARLQPKARRVDGWGMARLHQWVLERQGYWPHELAVLRSRLQAEIAAERDSGTAP